MYFFDRVNNTHAYRQLLSDTRDKNFITAFGVQPTEKPFVASGVEGFVLYVVSDYVESQRIWRTLNALGRNVVYLPHKEDVLLHKRNLSKNAVYQRNGALHAILNGATGAVVCVETLMQFLPQIFTFQSHCFAIEQGVCYNSKMLAKTLVECGYSRVDGISAEGQFVLRGDILDLSMPFGKRFRVDFFDDEVECIKQVSEDNQSKNKVDKVDVFPLYDTIGLEQDKLQQISALASRSKIGEDGKARLLEIVSELTASAGGGRADDCWLLPFVQSSTLWDYLPQNTTVVWDEPKLLQSRVDFLYNEHNTRVANLAEAGEILPLHVKSLVEQHNVFLPKFCQLTLQTLPYQSKFFQPNGIVNFKTTAVANYAGQEEKLANDVVNWKLLGYDVVILAGHDGVEPVRQKLAEHGAFVAYASKLSENSADGLVLPIGVEKGFVSHTNKLAVVGTRDLGRGLNAHGVQKNKRQVFLSVEKGDYVVHDVHGIGLCEGIEKITSPSGEVKDYIVVMYKHGDKLYVPVDNTNLLSRYSGGEHPSLSRLGGEDFAKVKSKVKSGIKAMSIDLLKLYAQREKARGFKYHVDGYLAEEFGRAFPFKPTPDQVKCQEEITADLTSNRIMDRVLVGDVGFGKTEVAMRATFDVVSNGYQVAVLAPTTILAEQHYNTFRERMQLFDIHVACLNRFRTAEQQRQILDDVLAGKVDVLVGTHRLLSKDVEFAKLGLLVLDEEQRFGVEHKEKIKAIKTSVDVLTMSATPIPRTLHMALSGIRDISTITTPPVERVAVETFVVEESDVLIADVINRELSRGGQVFVVYNRVQSIDAFAHKISTLVPSAQVIVAHGQMAESALEDAVVAFANGKGNVLVSTTIIENGIDIPNANTLIVHDADQLGLSQLYQLRGRVGRGNKLAYAYFTYKRDKILSEVAYKRLASITEYSELGSGFKIAMKDLEIRGAGNILGKEQHGHMVKVGYDMYARLLKEAVAELKGQQVESTLVTDVEISIDAYAPDSYIPVQTERMDFYQHLAGCRSVRELKNLQKQMADVYGVMPRQVVNLFSVATLKLLANKAGVAKVSVRPMRGELVFASKEKMFNKAVFDSMNDFGDRVSASATGFSVVFSSTDYMQKQRLMGAMVEFLNNIVKNNN